MQEPAQLFVTPLAGLKKMQDGQQNLLQPPPDPDSGPC